MVRNPYRPWWAEIEWDKATSAWLEPECERQWESTHCDGPGHDALRMRWAARTACRRLRAERDAAKDREARLRAALRLAISVGECEGPWAYICDSDDQPIQHEQRDKWCAWCQARAALEG